MVSPEERLFLVFFFFSPELSLLPAAPLISSTESLSSTLSLVLVSSSEAEDSSESTSLGLEAVSMLPMVSENIGFKMVNHSGSVLGDFPLPFFTRSVNFHHWVLRNLYLMRSFAGLVSNIVYFRLLVDLLFSLSFSSLNSFDNMSSLNFFEIS